MFDVAGKLPIVGIHRQIHDTTNDPCVVFQTMNGNVSDLLKGVTTPVFPGGAGFRGVCQLAAIAQVLDEQYPRAQLKVIRFPYAE